jgi:hypothetical protein
MHPEVVGVAAMGGYHERLVAGALCDRGDDRIGQSGECRAAGHDCWQRRLTTAPVRTEAGSGMSILEALDVLNTEWRLRFGKQHGLVHLTHLAEPVGLLGSCIDRDSFKGRLSDLGDVLNHLVVADDLLPPGTTGEAAKGSLNRMERALADALEADDVAQVKNEIGRLRKALRIRASLQHSGASDEFPTALAAVGLELQSDWAVLWAEVRAVARDALLGIRAVLQAQEG